MRGREWASAQLTMKVLSAREDFSSCPQRLRVLCGQKTLTQRVRSGGPANTNQKAMGNDPGFEWLRSTLTRTSHQVWTMLEGRGFSPAEITAPALYSSRTPRSLRLQAARGAGLGNNQHGLATAGLKPRPSRVVVRNPG